MSDLELTHHAIARMSQRGITQDDLRVVMRIGTEVEGGYLLRRKDYDALEHELKRLLDRVRKLVGKRFVVQDGAVVTAYHSNARDEQRLLRYLEKRNLYR